MWRGLAAAAEAQLIEARDSLDGPSGLQAGLRLASQALDAELQEVRVLAVCVCGSLQA